MCKCYSFYNILQLTLNAMNDISFLDKLVFEVDKNSFDRASTADAKSK